MVKLDFILKCKSVVAYVFVYLFTYFFFLFLIIYLFSGWTTRWTLLNQKHLKRRKVTRGESKGFFCRFKNIRSFGVEQYTEELEPQCSEA